MKDELSEAEIRNLLARKLHVASRSRLAHYRKNGRLVLIVPDHQTPALENFYAVSLGESDPQRLRPGKSLATHLLLFIVLAIVFGFTLVILSGLGALRQLNQISALAFELPALTPTPVIRAVVIPSGHIPPNARGETRPNEAEIPPHLRSLVQFYADLPVPTPGPEPGIRIQIPAIQVDAPIVQGDGWEQLKKGVGQNPGTADPGQKGNMVLTGHNDVLGEVFRYLDRLKPGDEITVYTSQRAYTYQVSGWKLVEPTQVEVLDPTPNATITLISCYPYLIDTQRIIVTGQLVN